VRRAILAAAGDLLDEVGFAAMTIERIAERAGVGKPTIYRRWPDKASIAMDALLAEIDPAAPYPQTGSAQEDFRLHAAAVAEVFTRPRIRQMLTGVIVEAGGNPRLHAAFRDGYMEPRRAQGRARLQEGIERGELVADSNRDLVFDQIYGPIYFRLLVTGDPLDRGFTDAIVREAFRGILATRR
jgi:AcrR family transcriptional regulator